MFGLFYFLLCKALWITILYEMCYTNKLALPVKDKQTVKTWQCDNEQQSELSIYQFDTNMLVNLIIDS